jgi:NAD(P)-dependent dehydrogenase (short-subunit alcohol dehydrogenase family)
MARFDGKVVLITGSAGGIGAAIVEEFTAQGAIAILCDKRAAEVERQTAALRGAGRQAFAAAADITDYDALAAAVGRATAQCGEVDIVVANAATTASAGSLASTTPASWRADTASNLAGAFNTVAVAIAAMQRRRAGSIVLTGSVNGLAALGNPAYSAAKAALINYTRSMAVEYGPYHIRANIVCPGTVRTPAWDERVARKPDIFAALGKWYPLGRVAEPADVAKAIAFLASDDAAFISGAVLPVDGGLMAGNRMMASELTIEPM